MDIWNDYVVIDDYTPNNVPFDSTYSRGGVPRDFSVQPAEAFADPAGMPLIPQSEWDARIDEQEREQSSLEHLYLRAGWENLDQGQWGYCWTHSVTHASMMARTRDNQPHVPLSAFAVAATIKKGANQGGWCGLAAQFARDRGIPSQNKWPQGDARYRTYDRPDVWEDAARYKVTEDWVDLARPLYSQNLTFAQVASCLLQNMPCALDFNWWAHSVCGVRLVRIERGRYGVLILNSWKNWGRRGLAVLSGQRMYPDGAVCTRVVSPHDPAAVRSEPVTAA